MLDRLPDESMLEDIYYAISVVHNLESDDAAINEGDVLT